MLRDDQIVEILELVDFRITKSELGVFFRDEKQENYMECGDQVLRNFFNRLVIHLRGTKENPKILTRRKHIYHPLRRRKERPEFKAKPRDAEKSRGDEVPSKSKTAKKHHQNNF
jgi:hypothetical protein